MMNRTELRLVLGGILLTSACGDSEDNRPSGGGGSGSVGSAAQDSSSVRGSGEPASGAGGFGGDGGGCLGPPSPEQCEQAEIQSDCSDGCTWALAVSSVTLDPDAGCVHLADSYICVAFDYCISAPIDGDQGYYRGEEVIETTPDCALLGWTPCSGESGEPEACSCTEDAGLTCD